MGIEQIENVSDLPIFRVMENAGICRAKTQNPRPFEAWIFQ